MVKPEWMTEEQYDLLSKAIEALDTAAYMLDEARCEAMFRDGIDPDKIKEDDALYVEYDEIMDNLQDYQDDVETMSYRLFCLIGGEKE